MKMRNGGPAGRSFLGVACPMCGHAGAHHEWDLTDRMYAADGRFTVRVCAECRSAFVLDPPPDLAPHYPPTYYSFADTSQRRGKPTAFGRITGKVVPARRLIDEEIAGGWKGQGRRVLDVGCGDGAALDGYARLGWETWGVEPGSDATETARANGHQVVHGEFLSAQLPEGTFQHVRFRHSLEHLSDPTAALSKAARLLRPEGTLLLELPNLAGWLARAAKKYYWQLDPPRHLVIPHRATIITELARAGFTTPEVTTYSFGRGVAVSALFWVRRAEFEAGHPSWYAGEPRLPKGYRLFRLAAYPIAVLTDVPRRGDNLRVLAKKASSGRPGER